MTAVITGANRPTMGTSAYRADAPRSADFRAGMMEAKPGMDKPGVAPSANSHRQGTTVESLGARCTIDNIRWPAGAAGSPSGATQRNTRLVRSATGTRDFWGG